MPGFVVAALLLHPVYYTGIQFMSDPVSAE